MRHSLWRAIIVGVFVGVTLALAIAGTSPGTRRTAVRAWLILTGGLVDVGGYRLYIECQGRGSPTVILEGGLNQPMQTWGSVPASMAQFTRVCVYERAGLGRSDPGPTPRTGPGSVDDLAALLAHGLVPPPYVLVGHSFGGQLIRLYASQYPAQVVGLVLVDASHEDQYTQYAALLPSAERETYLRHEAGGNTERIDLIATGEEVRLAPPLPAVRLAVLSAARKETEPGKPSEEERTHQALQASLARLSPHTTHIVTTHSGHFIQLDDPALVVDAIRDVVEAARR